MSYAKNPDTGSAEVLDRNDYYPFGMNFVGTGYYSVYDATGTPYNHKYNGKELQETGFYDYGWRQYMPDLGRWFGMDKLSETYSSTSPYAYVGNNPAMMFDPDGRVSYSWIAGLYNDAKPGGSTTYSDFDSNGNWGSSTFSPMGSGEITSFYNFLSSGQTGNFRYWTGTTSTTTSHVYNSSENISLSTSADTGVLNEIRIKDNGFWNDVWNKTLNFFSERFIMESEIYADAGPQLEVKVKALGIPVGFNIEGRHTEKFGFSINYEKNKFIDHIYMGEQTDNNIGYGIGAYGVDTTYSGKMFKTVSDETINYGPIGFKFNYKTGERSIIWTPLEGKISALIGVGGKLSFGFKY